MPQPYGVISLEYDSARKAEAIGDTVPGVLGVGCLGTVSSGSSMSCCSLSAFVSPLNQDINGLCGSAHASPHYPCKQSSQCISSALPALGAASLLILFPLNK